MRSAWLLGVFALLYAAIVVPHLSEAYIDFGDGNYLYISRRLADGVVLYRDVLAPQPPCHLLVGSVLIRLGRLLGQGVEAELYTVRVFSLLLHLATMVVVWAIARRLFGCGCTALWSAALYLVIPIGFWWTLGYQSEPLEVFFLLVSFLLVMRWDKRALAAAGVFAALAISTNMTAVCYVGWIALFLLLHDWRRALPYIAPAVVVVAAFVAVGEWLSEGHYLENVFFNQVGTFPHPEILRRLPPDAPYRTVAGYVFYKIAREGGDVMAREGIFIAAAVAGLLLYLRRSVGSLRPCARSSIAGRKPNAHEGLGYQQSESAGGEPDVDAADHAVENCDENRQSASGEQSGVEPPHSKVHNPQSTIRSRPAPPDYERAFVGWYGFWSFMAIGFVAKGATEDYIFTIGEPFVCIFAACAITDLGSRLFGNKRSAEQPGVRRPRILLAVVVALAAAVLFAWPALWIYATVRSQRHYELNAEDVKRVRFLIERQPGETILAPPYYAFISGRNLVEEHSEYFIWDIKYRLEQEVEKTTGPATLKVEAIAEALRDKAIPVVVLTMDPASGRPQQIYSIEPVREAIERNYRSLLPRPIPTLNTAIDVMVPKAESIAAPSR